MLGANEAIVFKGEGEVAMDYVIERRDEFQSIIRK